jgi:hypothetical protein
MRKAQFGDFLDDVGDVVDDVGEFIEDAGGTIGNIVKQAAPFIAMIPGVGTLAGAAIYAVGSVAAGDRISDIAISGIEAALPAEARGAYRKAVDVGYKVAQGLPVKNEVIAALREEARLQGGDPAVAAFDTGMAIGQGRGLQDAGFQVMGAWVAGNTAGERAVIFARDAAAAYQAGKPLDEFLLDAAANQLIKTIPGADQARALAAAIQYFIDHPEELVDQATGFTRDYINVYEMAERAGIPAAALRSAISIVLQMIDGHIVIFPDKKRLDRVTYDISMADMASRGFATAETNVSELDRAAARGNRIILDGITWYNAKTATTKLVANVRNGYSWSYTGRKWDPLTGILLPEMVTQTDVIDAAWRRGFDVGIAVADGSTADGPGQQRMRSQLTLLQAQRGFDAAQAIQFERTKHNALMKGIETMALALQIVNQTERAQLENAAKQGALTAGTSPQVAAARALNSDGRFRWGFDIATTVCKGSSIDGPGQTKARLMIGPGMLGGAPTDRNSAGSAIAQDGFNTGQALQHGLTKAQTSSVSIQPGSPAFESGQLIVEGLVASGASANQKASTVATVTSNPDARSGAATAIAANQGFWAKLLAFFGLGK